jgi:D-xylose 1-dehydrogenase (NADP+, D-xylono-1,5-lactone-forming)
MSNAPLRIGILGAADIARAFVTAVAASPLVEIVAVGSRTLDKAQAFARANGIAVAHGSYDALLADPTVEAIYNPLPNSLHAPWSIKAAEAGKHVLCEKPLAVDEAEARAMFLAARRNRVHLVEGFPYLAQPMMRDVRRLVADGTIGQLKLVRSTFGVPFSDPTNIRMIPGLAGGATMDAGSYAVSFLRVIAGKRPTRVTAIAQYAPTGVDETMIAMFEFADGLLAQTSASFATGYHRHGHVLGDKGYIDTMYLNHPPLGGPAQIQMRRGPTAATPIETVAMPEGNGFLLEAESFARMIRDGASNWTGATETESIDIAAMLAAMRESARSGKATTL